MSKPYLITCQKCDKTFCSADPLQKFHVGCKPEKIIYIKTSPEICLERIAQRSRGEEADIPIEYLRHIDRMHEEWLSKLDNVIVVDGSLQFDVDSILTELNII